MRSQEKPEPGQPSRGNKCTQGASSALDHPDDGQRGESTDEGGTDEQRSSRAAEQPARQRLEIEVGRPWVAPPVVVEHAQLLGQVHSTARMELDERKIIRQGDR